MIEVTLPWPPTELNPNSRVHWRKLAEKKKVYKDICAWQCKLQGLRKIEDKSLHLTITFYAPKKNQRYDLDNALASIKAGLDGISAIVGVDDGQWSLTIKKGGQVGGMVKVLIERVEDATAQ